MAVSPKFRVAICGGGPAGLALAGVLAKFNDPSSPIAIDLYESQSEIGTIGAGITVWPRTRVLLEQLGLIDNFKGELGADSQREGRGFSFRMSDQPAPGYPFYKLHMSRDPMMLHRSTLITTLQRGLPSEPLCTIHTSTRLLSYSYSEEDGHDDGPVKLHFADGSTGEADVIVGADGIRSAVRNSMFPQGKYIDENAQEHVVEAKWTGVIAYRSLITRAMLEAVDDGGHPALQLPMIYCGVNKHVVMYPISRGELINMVAFITVPGGYGTQYEGKWVRDASPEEMRSHYVGWEPELLSVLQCVESCSAWAIHIMENVPRCAIGRAAIVGDALHAMETHFGAGAGQAMEDTYVLGRILAHPATTKTTVAAALAGYEKSRLAFATGIVTRSRIVGQYYEFAMGPQPSKAEETAGGGNGSGTATVQGDWAAQWGEEVRRLWNFQWESPEADLDGFWKEAESQLLRSVAGQA